ncbi:MAG: hypothetical protein K5989_06085 [Lachnospiraceae bacterium]|nr:hypothetical protein [Lachnospiraceae bacterium]
MYFSNKKHLLSYSILATSIIRLLGSFIEAVSRILIRKSMESAPDMADEVLWQIQLGSSVLQLLLICGVFYIAYKKLYRYKSLVDEDDRLEMGRLQQEMLGKNLSSLSADAIGQLLQLWAVILIGAETVYNVSSMIYRNFVMELMSVTEADANFVSLYNLTHGFKYLEMLTAILLGVVVTGIFLKDILLKLVASLIALAFLLSFGIFRMQTVSFLGREVGIVWTSVIFHLTELFGLLLFSIYLSRRYKGL